MNRQILHQHGLPTLRVRGLSFRWSPKKWELATDPRWMESPCIFTCTLPRTNTNPNTLCVSIWSQLISKIINFLLLVCSGSLKVRQKELPTTSPVTKWEMLCSVKPWRYTCRAGCPTLINYSNYAVYYSCLYNQCCIKKKKSPFAKSDQWKHTFFVLIVIYSENSVITVESLQTLKDSRIRKKECYYSSEQNFFSDLICTKSRIQEYA